MAKNFNNGSIWKLKPIPISEVKNEIVSLLIDDEEILYVFKTIRDQLVFTNKRIISVDVQGVTGKKKEFTTFPYSRIQFYSVQTPSLVELINDSELYIMFANGFEAKYEFKDSKVDIVKEIAKTISKYVL